MTIPSPSEAVAASLSSAADAGTDANAEVAEIIAGQKPAEPAPQTETAKAAEIQPPTPKSLADSIVSDREPETVKATPSSDEPKEGEKPAAFIKRLKQERADALAQVEQFKSKASQRPEAAPDEIAALRKEISDRDQLLETDAFEKSHKFQTAHAKPLAAAEKSTKEFIDKGTETKGVFERALALDTNARAELLEAELGPVKAATALMKLETIDGLRTSRDAALTDRAEINKALASERESQNGAEVLKAFDGQREPIAAKLSYYRGENAEALVAKAKSLITGEAAPEDVISAAYLAVVAPLAIVELKAARAENAMLKARIAENDGDKPVLNGRGGDGGDGANGFIKDGRVLPMADVLKSQMADARK